jgi:hypothetical protein
MIVYYFFLLPVVAREGLENMAIQLIRSVLAVSLAVTSSIKNYAAPILVENERENMSDPSLQSSQP